MSINTADLRPFSYAQTIKVGLDAAGRLWKAALIRLLFIIISIIGAAIVIGLIIIIGWLISGTKSINLHEITNIFNVGNLSSPLIGKYIGLLLLSTISFLIYSIIILTAAIFIFGGSCGVITLGIKDPSYHFKMIDFISIGKKTFFTMIWFTTLISILAVFIFIVLGLDSWLTYRIINDVKGYNNIISFFILLISIIFNISMIMFLFAITFYGTASIYLKGKSAKAALGDAVNLIMKRPSSIWFIFIVGLFYVLSNLVFVMIGLIMSKLPIIGIYIAIPFDILIYFIQSLLSIAMIGSIFYYYGYYSIRSVLLSETEPSQTLP